MLRSWGIPTVLALGLLISVFAAGPAFGADPEAAPAFGTVDVEKAFDDYDKKKQLDEELRALADGLKLKLELRNESKLLTAAEFDQLAELKAKATPGEADKKKIDELLATARQREQELQTLQQKQDTSTAEKARLKELTEQATKAEITLREDAAKYQNEVANRQIELSRQVMEDIEAAVAEIAKAKGLTLVFNKSVGEPGLIIYSSLDITDEVLKKLNKQ